MGVVGVVVGVLGLMAVALGSLEFWCGRELVGLWFPVCDRGAGQEPGFLLIGWGSSLVVCEGY